jgi:hypothetical protein
VLYRVYINDKALECGIIKGLGSDRKIWADRSISTIIQSEQNSSRLIVRMLIDCSPEISVDDSTFACYYI